MEGPLLKYLLDTSPWINGVTVPEVFPERIRGLMRTGEPKGLASVSLLETAILHRLGRLGFSGTIADFFAVGLAADIQVVELTPAIACKTNELPATFQGDPFDRAIAATASVLKLTLITCDPEIRDSGVCAVEYYPFKPLRSRRA